MLIPSNVVTIKNLIEAFPIYEKEITNLVSYDGTLACNCPMCVWIVLKKRHNELVIPNYLLEKTWSSIWG